MQNLRILIKNSMARHFHASCSKCSNNTVRQSNIFKKIMAGGRSKRKGFYLNANVNNKPVIFDKTKKEQPAYVLKRLSALNKIFMEHITDFMTTGEIAPEILDLNIEISHVQVAEDFKHVTIHWLSSNEASINPQTDELLRQCGYKLRHELSQLRVMGNVPPICFVRCKRLGSLLELERRLKVADYGEDFHRSTYTSEPTETITNNETEIAKNATNEEGTFSVSVPVMRNDVFGLDHNHIMSKVKASLNKSRIFTNELPVNNRSNLLSQSIPSFISSKEQEEQFRNFLAKRAKDERSKYKVKRFKGAMANYYEEEEDNDCANSNEYNDDYNDYDDYDDNFENETDNTYQK